MKDLRIEIIQMGGVNYFWALVHGEGQILARSSSIVEKNVAEKEVDDFISVLCIKFHCAPLPIILNERG